MSRAWRCSCPQYVKRIYADIDHSSFQVQEVKEPTKISLKDATRIYAVSLGPIHKCSCRSQQPCIHLLFTLKIIYGLELDNPLMWQTGLTELEVMDLTTVKIASNEGVCYFCRERLSEQGCETCGLHFHANCVEMRSKLTKTDAVCPRCNHTVNIDLGGALGRCDGCHSSTRGGLKCLLCHNFFLCRRCYELKKYHMYHPFAESKILPKRKEPLKALEDASARELNPEDYDLLLSLDKGNIKNTLSLHQFEKLTTLFFGEDMRSTNHTCEICMDRYIQGCSVVLLPCGHVFHTCCGRRWLTEEKSTCPIDHKKVRIEFSEEQ